MKKIKEGYTNDLGIRYRVLNFADEASATTAWEELLGAGKFCKLVQDTDKRWQVHIPVR
jgi:hypothetical protein